MLASYSVWFKTIDYNPNSCKLFTCVFYQFETSENGGGQGKNQKSVVKLLTGVEIWDLGAEIMTHL